MKKNNKKIAKILYEIAELLDIKGVKFKPKAYKKAAKAVKELKLDISEIYKQEGLKGLEKIEGVGKSIAKKIEEYLKKGKLNTLKNLKKKQLLDKLLLIILKQKEFPWNNLKEMLKREK